MPHMLSMMLLIFPDSQKPLSNPKAAFLLPLTPPTHPRPNPKRMNPDHISLHNKQFEPYLSAQELTAAIR